MSTIDRTTLNKSIDSMIDEIFVEKEVKKEEIVEKSEKVEVEEEVVAEKEEIVEKSEPITEKEEVVAEKEEVKEEIVEKSEKVEVEELTKSDKLELEEFRKAKVESEAEDLKKAEKDAQETLIKSVIEKVSVKYEEKIEILTKSLDEQKELVKKIASTPRTKKSVTNIAALEKSQKVEEEESRHFSKSEILDAGEELVKKGAITTKEFIELDSCGDIKNPKARKLIEDYLDKK